MRKKTYLLWKKILFRFFVTGVTLFLFFGYFYSNLFTITTYELVGVLDALQPELQTKLHELAKVPMYRVIPSNKILTYPGMRIKALITTTLPNTETVTISLRSLHTLRITVMPFVPLFKVDEAHAITKSSYVYASSQNLNAYPLLSVASSTYATTSVDGIFYTNLVIPHVESTEDLLLELSALIPKINSVLFTVAEININEDGDLTLWNSTKKSSLKLSVTANKDKTWSTVISAIDTEPLKSLLETKKEALEYIDTRFGNKVFYKFTNTKIPTIINASTTNATTSTSTLH